MADERPICPKCNAPMVPGCDGQGYILVNREVDDGFNPEHVQQCPNLYARQLKDHLGNELAQVQHVTASPLYDPTREVDRTASNILISDCPWRNLLPHLKWALGMKGLLFFFRIITDERLKNVWVGNEQYKSLSAEARDVVPTFNSLADLLGPDQDLVIIKLGYFGQHNRAAAGLLKEALLIRESLHKATWLVLDPNRPWTHSYNPDVAEYVGSNFKGLKIEASADPGIELPTDIMLDEDDDEENDVAEIMAEVETNWEDPAPAPRHGGEGGGDSGLDEGPMS